MPYTKEDIRFVVNKDSIYAFVMKFPKDGHVVIRSLSESRDQNSVAFHGLIADVKILGYENVPLTWSRDENGLYVDVNGIETDMPVAVQIIMK